MITRRQLGLLGAAGLLAPRRLAAAPSSAARRFLFVFCDGGWDTNHVFTPMLDSPNAYIEPDAVRSEVGGIPFVDHPQREPVRAFFEEYADRTCVINGLEVRSVAHERCRQLVLTGRGDVGGDDWPTILGARTSESLTMPHLVLDGPSFSARYSSQVVRVGDEGQLQSLLTGDALLASDLAVAPPSALANDLEDAFVAQQLASLSAEAGRGAQSDLLSRYADAAERHLQLQALGDRLALAPEDYGCERDLVADAAAAFDCFELGLSRCAMIRYRGWCSEGWDTHQDHPLQSTNFHDLFSYLSGILFELEGRTAPSGGPLADAVTIVVFSEMGRAPSLNSWQGKDHWTFTSAMLIGAGVRGGRVLGALDERGLGQPIDLVGGGVSAGGVALDAAHLGATLLAMGDVDPGEYLTDVPPIEAALS